MEVAFMQPNFSSELCLLRYQQMVRFHLSEINRIYHQYNSEKDYYFS